MNETDLITKIILGTAVQEDFEAVSPYLEELLSILQSNTCYTTLAEFSFKVDKVAAENDLIDIIDGPNFKYELILYASDTYEVIKRPFI